MVEEREKRVVKKSRGQLGAAYSDGNMPAILQTVLASGKLSRERESPDITWLGTSQLFKPWQRSRLTKAHPAQPLGTSPSAYVFLVLALVTL